MAVWTFWAVSDPALQVPSPMAGIVCPLFKTKWSCSICPIALALAILKPSLAPFSFRFCGRLCCDNFLAPRKSDDSWLHVLYIWTELYGRDATFIRIHGHMASQHYLFPMHEARVYWTNMPERIGGQQHTKHAKKKQQLTYLNEIAYQPLLMERWRRNFVYNLKLRASRRQKGLSAHLSSFLWGLA